MRNKKKAKIAKWSLAIVAILLCVILVNSYHSNKLNSNLEFPPAMTDTLALFKLEPSCTFTSTTGIEVFFDMGSRHSFIDKQTVERLQQENYDIKVKPVLIFTVDNNGHYSLYTRKAIIDVLLPNAQMADSVYTLSNIELLVSNTPNNNTIGMDILGQMAIEFIDSISEIRMYRQVPPNYRPICEIDMHRSGIGNLFGVRNRASIKMSVNDADPIDYCFDTGGLMRSIDLVQPTAMESSATSEITIDSVTGYRVQKHCRVAYGDRMKYGTVVYSDTLHTDKYSVNPLNIFDQDIVLDFPGGKLWSKSSRK